MTPTETRNTPADSRTTAALELYAALITEASSWACDDDPDTDEFHHMPPDQVIDAIAEHCLVPTHLLEAIVGALTELDPSTYRR
ncbi:hypothetical protein [Nocardia sp. NPDC004260]